MTRPHWLTPATKTVTPDTVVTFDTETTTRRQSGSEIMTLKCWDLIIRCRSHTPSVDDVTATQSGETASGLCDALVNATELTGEAWAFAHNVGFDLTVTSLPMQLEERGWEPKFVSIGDESCVFVMRKDDRKLTITDSWSWLRCSLDTAARDAGMRKVRLPRENDPLSKWHRRCQHDVEILDRLVADLLDWWDTQQLGRFGLTGSACGWSTLRSHIQPKSVLVGSDGDRTRLAREALFGGRKEVWRVGRLRGRWIDDYDLVSAHLTTVRECPLPTRPIGQDSRVPLQLALSPPDGFGAVCRVEISTKRPCAPVRLGDDVWWPVGRFRTVLTTAELPAVVTVADSVTVLEAQWYGLSDALGAWGAWCSDLLAGNGPAAPAVVRRVAKGWGRSVPGRFALRKSELVRERPATHLGWAIETGHDLATGDAIEVVTYGGIERTYRKNQDGVDVSPAILAFVEGYVRAAMLHVLGGREPGQLLQCNTDGWWEFRASHGQPHATNLVPKPYEAVRKATSHDVTVIGPNHITSKNDVRLAGIPSDAKRGLDGSFAWQDWPGLRYQLQFSRPGEYIRPGREIMLHDHYCRRWVLDSGLTRPVDVRLTSGGSCALMPWSETSQREPGDRLAEYQVPALMPLARV